MDHECLVEIHRFGQFCYCKSRLRFYVYFILRCDVINELPLSLQTKRFFNNNLLTWALNVKYYMLQDTICDKSAKVRKTVAN